MSSALIVEKHTKPNVDSTSEITNMKMTKVMIHITTRRISNI